MRVISKPRLRAFWQEHPDAETPLSIWWKTVLKADWTSIRDVRVTFPHAEAVEVRSGLIVTVFNVAGNKCRLITRIIYECRRSYVKWILTHAEYDKEKWKVQLCRE